MLLLSLEVCCCVLVMQADERDAVCHTAGVYKAFPLLFHFHLKLFSGGSHLWKSLGTSKIDKCGGEIRESLGIMTRMGDYY